MSFLVAGVSVLCVGTHGAGAICSEMVPQCRPARASPTLLSPPFRSPSFLSSITRCLSRPTWGGEGPSWGGGVGSGEMHRA